MGQPSEMKQSTVFFVIGLLLASRASLSLADSLGCQRVATVKQNNRQVILEAGLDVRISWDEGSHVPFLAVSPGVFAQTLRDLKVKYEHELAMIFPNRILLRRLDTSEYHKGYSGLFCKNEQSTNEVVIDIADDVTSDLLTFQATISHELLHALFYRQNRNFPLWFEEGLALLFQSKMDVTSTYNVSREHLEFSPYIGLNYSKDALKELPLELRLSFYGHSFLLTKYIEDQFGLGLLKFVASQEGSDPLEIIPLYIKNQIRKRLSFKNIYHDFSLAKYINQFDNFPQPLNRDDRYVIDTRLKVNQQIRMTTRSLPSLSSAVLHKTQFRLADELVYVVLTFIGEILINPTDLRPKNSESLFVGIHY